MTRHASTTAAAEHLDVYDDDASDVSSDDAMSDHADAGATLPPAKPDSASRLAADSKSDDGDVAMDSDDDAPCSASTVPPVRRTCSKLPPVPFASPGAAITRRPKTSTSPALTILVKSRARKTTTKPSKTTSTLVVTAAKPPTPSPKPMAQLIVSTAEPTPSPSAASSQPPTEAVETPVPEPETADPPTTPALSETTRSSKTPPSTPKPAEVPPPVDPVWVRDHGAGKTKTTSVPSTVPTSQPVIGFLAPTAAQMAKLLEYHAAGTLLPVAEMNAMVNLHQAPVTAWAYVYTGAQTRSISEEKALAAAIGLRLKSVEQQRAMAALVRVHRDTTNDRFAFGFHLAGAPATLAGAAIAFPVKIQNGKPKPQTFYFELPRPTSGYHIDIPDFAMPDAVGLDCVLQDLKCVAPSLVFGQFHSGRLTPSSHGSYSSRYRLFFLDDDVPEGLTTSSGRLVDGIRVAGRTIRWYGKDSKPHYQRVEWLDLDVITNPKRPGVSNPKRQKTADVGPAPWTVVKGKRMHDGDLPKLPFSTGNIYSVLRDRVEVTFMAKTKCGVGNKTVAYGDMHVKAHDLTDDGLKPDPQANLHRILVHQGRSTRVEVSFDQLLAEFQALDEASAAMEVQTAARRRGSGPRALARPPETRPWLRRRWYQPSTSRRTAQVWRPSCSNCAGLQQAVLPPPPRPPCALPSAPGAVRRAPNLPGTLQEGLRQ